MWLVSLRNCSPKIVNVPFTVVKQSYKSQGDFLCTPGHTSVGCPITPITVADVDYCTNFASLLLLLLCCLLWPLFSRSRICWAGLGWQKRNPCPTSLSLLLPLLLPPMCSANLLGPWNSFLLELANREAAEEATEEATEEENKSWVTQTKLWGEINLAGWES